MRFLYSLRCGLMVYFLNGNFRDAFFINDFIRLSGLVNTEPLALWSYFHSSLAFISCMVSTLLMLLVGPHAPDIKPTATAAISVMGFDMDDLPDMTASTPRSLQILLLSCKAISLYEIFSFLSMAFVLSMSWNTVVYLSCLFKNQV